MPGRNCFKGVFRDQLLGEEREMEWVGEVP